MSVFITLIQLSLKRNVVIVFIKVSDVAKVLDTNTSTTVKTVTFE